MPSDKPGMIRQPTRLHDIDPYALARRGAVLVGPTATADLDRLASALIDTDGAVDWRAQFSTRQMAGDATQYWLDLDAQAALSVPCSQCAEPVTLPVTLATRLRLVADEAQAAALDESADDHDVVAADQHFDLVDLLQDELIMALPAFPEHDRCPIQPGRGELPGGQVSDDAASESGGSADRQFPFADLATRLGKK